MAWITKNSGGATIEQRSEPYLTPAMKQDLTSRVLPRYEDPMGALLPCLHAVQHQYGWVPPQAMKEIAEFLKIAPSVVLDTASFYEEYWLKPKGKHLIAVCRSIACEFRGQPKITDAVRAKLGIDVGETTDDGKYTLVEVECLGACDGGPVALVDEALHVDLTPDSIVKAIDGAKDHGHH